MIIFPAIDLYEGKAVRLFKGDYAQMTVYSENPVDVALDFKKAGATHIHLVDLEGAKSGTTPNLDTVCKIKSAANLFCEVGGGIRSMEVVDRYIGAGVDRVILGTAAVTNPEFLQEAVKKHGSKIAVGVDIKDGKVAIHGWTQTDDFTCEEFIEMMQNKVVKTIICNDISMDRKMISTILSLYKELSQKFNIDIVASGGVSSIDDVTALKEMNLYGAILGKALYTNSIDLAEAISISKE